MKKSLASKLLAVGILSYLPVVGLLYTLTQELSISTTFANKEIKGLEYIKIIKNHLENIPSHKLLNQRFLLGASSLKGDIVKKQRQIDDTFSELSTLSSKYSLDKLVDDKISSLKQEWERLKAKAFSRTSEKSDTEHTILLNNLKKLIISIGDSSNLTRDPDISSFYLVDSVLDKLTSKINLSDSVIQISDKIIADKGLSSSQKSDEADLKDLLGDDEKSKNKNTDKIDLDDKANLTILIGLLENISDDLKDSYAKVFSNEDVAKVSLESILNEEQKTTQDFIKMINSTLIKSNNATNTQKIASMGNNVIKANFNLLLSSVSVLEDLLNKRIKALDQRKYIILLLSIALSSIAVILGIMIIKGIVNSISKLEVGAQKVSKGDLDVLVDIKSDDELGSLSNSFNVMVEGIKSANKKLKEGSVSMEILEEKIQAMNKMTSELQKAKEESERNSFHLESLVKETSASIYEIKQTSDLVADNARIVSEAAELSVHISSEGQKAVNDSINSVEKTKTQIETVAEKILELSKQTQTIGEIISTVDDISKQSRLLAFNAAIEASKANEYGKGFSVVAGEIKALSEESREATKRISSILGQIQNLTNTIVMLTEDGMKLADIGSELSKKAGTSIDKLIESINNSAEVASQISVSSVEQKTGMEQLEESMRNIAFRGRN